VTIEKGELATSVIKSKNEIHLLGRCWERQTTSLIAFIFGLLVIVSKKVVCLQCGFKSWRKSKDITVVMTSYYENICWCKRHTVVHHAFCFLVIRFTLSWPCNSLLWVLTYSWLLYQSYCIDCSALTALLDYINLNINFCDFANLFKYTWWLLSGNLRNPPLSVENKATYILMVNNSTIEHLKTLYCRNIINPLEVPWILILYSESLSITWSHHSQH